MQILLLEPFFTGSHASWANGLKAVSQYEVQILSLKGNFWKWRMHGGAVTLAHQFLKTDIQPDLILATDMLDITTFLALTRRRTADIPIVLYMHENQITYPWSPTDKDKSLERDRHYGFINYTSALAADKMFFNSYYHLHSFFEALPQFLKAFPDHQELSSVETIRKKSQVLPLGLNLQRFDTHQPTHKSIHKPPLILWNHRWEYDKGPEIFFKTLFQLKEEGLEFELAVLGQHYGKIPAIFKEAKSILKDRIVHWGYVKDFQTYAKWLWEADIVPVTSIHDFFGISLVEALYCQNFPLLPYRLAYPEHVPEAWHENFFYQDDQDLAFRLKTILVDKSYHKMSNWSLREYVRKYDWGCLGAVYDQLMAEN